MTFKEFFLLHEERFYYAYLDRNGEYFVNSHPFDNPRTRDMEAMAVRQDTKPVKMWNFAVNPGDHQINIPGASPQEKEQIGLAYYKRMGFDTHASHDYEDEDIEGDVISPKDFDKNYWRKLAAQKLSPMSMKPGGTMALKPKQPAPDHTIDFVH